MAGPIELLIVAGAFGIIGFYLYIVSRFIRSGERSTADSCAPLAVKPDKFQSRVGKSPAHAH